MTEYETHAMTDPREELRNQAADQLKKLGVDLSAGKEGARTVGRILRAHLVVEACLRRHVQVMNPNLGPIKDLRLNFDRLRMAAVGMKEGRVAWADDALTCLNKLRNDLAHEPDRKISCDDVGALQRDADALLCDSVARDRLAEIKRDPAWIVETWAKVFGAMLATEEAMLRLAADAEARERELKACAVQLLRELLDDSG